MKNNKKLDHFTSPILVCAMAFSFFNLAWSILFVNIPDDNIYEIGHTLAMITAISIVITWGSALFGKIKLSYIAVLLSLILWSAFVVFWILTILIGCALNNNVTLVNSRGPESFWLASNQYNKDIASAVNYEYYYYTPVDDLFGGGSRYVQQKQLDFLDDEEDDGANAYKMFNFLFMKWLFIVLDFTFFACLVFGAWYVLICYYQEMNNRRICRRLANETNTACRVTCCRELEPNLYY